MNPNKTELAHNNIVNFKRIPTNQSSTLDFDGTSLDYSIFCQLCRLLSKRLTVMDSTMRTIEDNIQEDNRALKVVLTQFYYVVLAHLTPHPRYDRLYAHSAFERNKQRYL